MTVKLESTGWTEPACNLSADVCADLVLILLKLGHFGFDVTETRFPGQGDRTVSSHLFKDRPSGSACLFCGDRQLKFPRLFTNLQRFSECLSQGSGYCQENI